MQQNKNSLICLGTIFGMLLWSSSTAHAQENNAIKGALIEKFLLPYIKEKVAELDKTFPSETHYGLKGDSVGRNGLREEVDNHDIMRDGKKVNETRFNYFDKFAWAEGEGTWGPPGFQYYVFRHPLAVTFDPKSLEFTLSTKLEFKVAVAVNYDTGFLGFKPFVFGDSGFGDNWPNELDISIKSGLEIDKDGILATRTQTHVVAKKPIVLETFHGLKKRDCSAEVVDFLKKEMDKVAAKFDAETKELQEILSGK
jgi:hypothetical protein